MNIVAQVQDLSRNDMIYIYHHLALGKKVEVRSENEFIHSIYFKGFKLGFIRIPEWINKSVEKFKIDAEINALSKRKYLPLDGLDVKLSLTTIAA